MFILFSPWLLKSPGLLLEAQGWFDGGLGSAGLLGALGVWA